jgi:hypothetical protein
MRTAPLKIAIALTALMAAAALTIPTLSAYSSPSANVGSTFATAASYSTCPNQTITSGHVTGFETGRPGSGADRFQSQGLTPVFDTSVVRTGNYSLRVAASGSASNVNILIGNPVPTTEVARFAIRLASLPTGNVSQLFGMSAFSNSVQLRYIAATQRLAVAMTPTAGGAATVTQASSTVTAGAWYVIEIRYAVGTATHAVDWQINEVAQPGATLASTASMISQLTLGTAGADTFTAHYDDVVFSTNGAHYPLGDGRVHTLRPNGVGTHVGPASFIDDDGTAIDANSWQRLDETPMNTMTDFVQQTGSSSANYLAFTLADTTETCIRAVEGAFSAHSATTQTNNAKVTFVDGPVEREMRTGVGAGPTSREYGKIVAPATTWSQSALNGLVARFGYGSDLSPNPILDALIVEYEVPQ